MDEELKECWQELIQALTAELLKNKIRFVLTAPGSSFLKEEEAEFEHITILVEWGVLDMAHKVLQKFGASAIQSSEFSEFEIKINSFEVVVLSSPELQNFLNDGTLEKIELDGMELFITNQHYK